MPTATLHIADVGGFAGPARTYKLEPAVTIDGIEIRYVTLWIQKGYAHQLPEIVLIPADEQGDSINLSLKRFPGSLVLRELPDTPEHMDGIYWSALKVLGDYDFPALPIESDSVPGPP
ncbi:hypothetical protein ACIBCN_18890 [Nocardia sp. NPDC051052]|uniref:hypothetical protein n=1 Tax=Nocardia sp. NPDC051052 TaxID=3364322 RepID=UPI0037B3340B